MNCLLMLMTVSHTLHHCVFICQSLDYFLLLLTDTTQLLPFDEQKLICFSKLFIRHVFLIRLTCIFYNYLISFDHKSFNNISCMSSLASSESSSDQVTIIPFFCFLR